MRRGRFIALEGGEGAGKSTHARLLADALTARGIDTVVTREPGGTPGAEAIRVLLLDPEQAWGMRAEALLFAAARADHVERLIMPALDAGRWVICDRFVDSSRAYQGGGGGLTDGDVLELHRIGSGGLLPDLTVLIEVSPDEAARRTTKRDGAAQDRIGGRGVAYHGRVAATFRALAQAEPGRFAVIDGNSAVEAVAERILAAVEPLAAAC